MGECGIRYMDQFSCLEGKAFGNLCLLNISDSC